MTPRRRKAKRATLGLDMTPMVDVVFLLIIFFMVSTTFITLESGMPVDLPQAQSAQAQASNLPTVTVTRDQDIFVSGTAVAESDLLAVLRRSLSDVPLSNRVVVLRADQNVPHGTTVRVMDIIRQAGAQRIAIATGG